MGAGAIEKQEVVINDISSLDEPSVEWGWHHHSKKIGLGVGIFFVVFTLGMLIGNHDGRVEDLYLIGTAILLVIGLVMMMRTRDPKKEAPKQSRVYDLPAGHYALNPAGQAYDDVQTSKGVQATKGAAAGKATQAGTREAKSATEK